MNTVGFDTTLVLIDGAWRHSASGQTLPLLNPSDGSVLTQIARGNAADIDAAVAAAQAALTGPWGELTAAERGRILLKMSALTLARADEVLDAVARASGVDPARYPLP